MSWFDFLWRKPQPKAIAPSAPPPAAAPASLPTMLILRGIAGHFGGRDWPRGALDEPPALEYARRRGYVGEVLDVAGTTGPQSLQVRMCLEAIRERDDIVALYGFSGGGYNIRHVLAALSEEERRRIKLVVVLGAPNNPSALYRDGTWELVYRRDPPAGHMAGPQALLDELAAATTAARNPLAGKPLRYLIGADMPPEDCAGEIVEVGYDVTRPPRNGIAIKYCNLFDEHNTGRYGPYRHTSNTAARYCEGEIDPHGPGWERNLREQFERACAQGFRFVELDNPDAYSLAEVLGAVDLAADYGFKVIAKNPLLMDGDPLAYVAHRAVVGAIVEQDAGTPADMDDLRRRADKPDLPVWFVAFGETAGRTWAMKIARQAEPIRNMGVTFSPGSEYGSSVDILRPQ